MTTTVYRSTHPTVLEAWQAAREQADEIGRRRAALLDELGERRLRVNGLRVVGVEHRPEQGAVPDGWRRDRDNADVIVPDRRRAAGRAFAARLAALELPDPRRDLCGGMPHTVWPDSGGHAYRPGMRLLGGAVYVTWPGDPEEERGHRIDPAVWERVKPGEHYAAAEADVRVGGEHRG